MNIIFIYWLHINNVTIFEHENNELLLMNVFEIKIFNNLKYNFS